MALALKDRVKETTIVVGTGAATLLGSSIGFQPFSVVGNGNTTYYCISDQFGSNWEVGIGTYSSSGNTLARTTVLSSSNAGALVVFTAGIKDVFVTYPAEKGVWLDASGNAIGLGTPASGVVTNLTGTASININGTVGATTATTGAFTTLAYTGTLTGGTGVLAIGTNQIYKDASGNVGIGTSSPGAMLDVNGYAHLGQAGVGADISFLSTAYGFAGWYGGTAPNGNSTDANLGVGAIQFTGGGSNGLTFLTSPNTTAGTARTFTERMRIDSSGNVLVGTTVTPSSSGLSVGSTGIIRQVLGGLANTSWRIRERDYVDSVSWSTNMNDAGVQDDATKSSWSTQQGYGSGQDMWRVGRWAAGSPTFVEAMRINSSGNVLVGTTSALATPSRIAVVYPGDTTWGIGFKSSYLTGNGQPCTFINSSNAVIGYIGTNGTATSYITSSDYRLKENITPIVGALDKIANLNPVTYIWKDTDNEVGEGFIAHELQAICPLAVSGEKDAVNKDGSIKAQGIDPSKLVALLTASIQELKAIIDTQQEQINSLLGK